MDTETIKQLVYNAYLRGYNEGKSTGFFNGYQQHIRDQVRKDKAEIEKTYAKNGKSITVITM